MGMSESKQKEAGSTKNVTVAEGEPSPKKKNDKPKVESPKAESSEKNLSEKTQESTPVDPATASAATSSSKPKVEDIDFLANSRKAAAAAAKKKEPKVNEKGEEIGEDFVLLEWNIQGLEDKHLKERMNKLCDLITRHQPDVVLLQEVNASVLRVINHRIDGQYRVFDQRTEEDNENMGRRGGYGGGLFGRPHYYLAILVKESNIKGEHTEIRPYSSSKQGRHIMSLRCEFRGVKMWLLTAHLESMKNQTEARREQFEVTCDYMQSEDDSSNVIFACDSNLLDEEYADSCKEYENVRENTIDCWMALGSPDDTRYTWDLTMNDNQVKDGTERLRYERIFMRKPPANSKKHLKPKSLELIGKERLPCGMFVSDHWGMLMTFSNPVPYSGGPYPSARMRRMRPGFSPFMRDSPFMRHPMDMDFDRWRFDD